MPRPKMSYEAKWAAIVERFWANTVQRGDDECWPMKSVQHYYTMGREERYRPCALSWVIHFPDRGLPPNPTQSWIGNKDTCIESPCMNPRHLIVCSNTPNSDKVRRVPEPVATLKDGQAVVHRGDGTTRVVWVDQEKKAAYLRDHLPPVS